jgi:hypothetical protein
VVTDTGWALLYTAGTGRARLKRWLTKCMAAIADAAVQFLLNDFGDSSELS